MLMEKAEQLYLSDRNFESVENGILGQLSEVIALDSNNTHASEMLTKSIGKYKKSAEKLFQKRQYTDAKTIYEFLLTFNTGDKDARRWISKINSAIAKAGKSVLANGGMTEKPAMAGLIKNNDEGQSQKSETNTAAGSATILTQTPVRETEKQPAASRSENIRRDSLAETANRIVMNESLAKTEDPKQEIAARTASTQQQAANNANNTLSSNAPVLESFLDAGQRQLIKKVDPDYPRAYLKIKKEGTVIIEAIVGKYGRVISHRVLQSNGDLFTEVCVRALRKYKYKTGTVNNVPVRFKVTELFKFKIE